MYFRTETVLIKRQHGHVECRRRFRPSEIEFGCLCVTSCTRAHVVGTSARCAKVAAPGRRSVERAATGASPRTASNTIKPTAFNSLLVERSAHFVFIFSALSHLFTSAPNGQCYPIALSQGLKHLAFLSFRHCAVWMFSFFKLSLIFTYYNYSVPQ